MHFSLRIISLITVLASFAFSQTEVKQEAAPELMKDPTSGKALQMDFSMPLAGVNDPGMLFAHFSGKPLLIYYFSPKCPHCQANFSGIQDIVKEFESKGLTGLAISIGGGIKKNDIRLFIDKFNAAMPVFQDVNAKFGPTYGTGYVPVVFIVNKDGTFYRFGELSKNSKDQIHSILNGMFP